MNLYLKVRKQEITLLPSQAKALQTAIKATKLLIYVMFYLLNNLTLEKFYKLTLIPQHYNLTLFISS